MHDQHGHHHDHDHTGARGWEHKDRAVGHTHSEGAHASGGRNHDGHSGHGSGHDHQSHHAHMVADFRRRFWVCLVLSVPVVALAPMIQTWLGLRDSLRFPGDSYIQFAFATIVYFYGGWPFLKGLFSEVGKGRPGMMTLIAVAALTVFADLGLPPMDAAQDRAMVCGSMAFNLDVKAVLEGFGLREGANSDPREYVVEKAFVGDGI